MSDRVEDAIVRLFTQEATENPSTRALVAVIDEAARDPEAAIAAFDRDRHDLASIVPIDTARKPRTRERLAVDVHNAGLLLRFDHGEHAGSRRYVELVDTNARTIIARDPMPSIMAVDAEGVLAPEYVELPGPNCLDTLSERLKLTDAERIALRTRREDAALMLAEYAAIRRAELETP